MRTVTPSCFSGRGRLEAPRFLVLALIHHAMNALRAERRRRCHRLVWSVQELERRTAVSASTIKRLEISLDDTPTNTGCPLLDALRRAFEAEGVVFFENAIVEGKTLTGVGREVAIPVDFTPKKRP